LALACGSLVLALRWLCRFAGFGASLVLELRLWLAGFGASLVLALACGSLVLALR